MGHLTIESLARLVSEAPSPEEREHLDSCSECQAELRALLSQTEAMGALPDLRPPAGDWEALEARLVSEGLIRTGRRGWMASRWRSSGWLQAAAALVLFLGGTALGSRATGDSPSGDLAGTAAPPNLELIPVGSQAQPVTSLSEAAETVRLAERVYFDALLQYRQLLDSQGQPSYLGDPASRFAALEALVAAGRAAVQQAPADPFVNGVLVSAMAERDALLQNASLTTRDGIF